MAKEFEAPADEVVDDKPRVKAAVRTTCKTTTSQPSMEKLIEVIDEVETMVRIGKPKEALLAKLKQAADLATRINNGGAK